MVFLGNLGTGLNLPCSLGDERSCRTSRRYTGSYDSKKPDLVFEFRYRPIAVLQALRVIPLLKHEAPSVIDLEDEGTQPSPKRRKTTDEEGRVQSMKVNYC